MLMGWSRVLVARGVVVAIPAERLLRASNVSCYDYKDKRRGRCDPRRTRAHGVPPRC